MRAADTTGEAHARQVAAYRRMTGQERTSILFRLNQLTRETALAGIRSRHPHYSAEQAGLALRRLTLGDEITRSVWPDRPLVDP